MGNAAAAKKMMMLGVRENPGFDFKQPTIVQLQGVIPGRCEASNPESRDSGSGAGAPSRNDEGWIASLRSQRRLASLCPSQ
jgi:hypothetical protein